MDDQQDKPEHKGSENLKPFKSGDEWSGNASGRPKGSKNRSTIFKELLAQQAFKKITTSQTEALSSDGEALEQSTVADQVATALLLKALSGDVPAAREILDSAHGKLTDKVDNTHSFSQMGRVTAQLESAEGDERAPKTQELTFDVGSEPNKLEGEDED